MEKSAHRQTKEALDLSEKTVGLKNTKRIKRCRLDDLPHIALKAFSIKVISKNIYNTTHHNKNNLVVKTPARDQWWM